MNLGIWYHEIWTRGKDAVSVFLYFLSLVNVLRTFDSMVCAVVTALTRLCICCCFGIFLESCVSGSGNVSAVGICITMGQRHCLGCTNVHCGDLYILESCVSAFGPGSGIVGFAAAGHCLQYHCGLQAGSSHIFESCSAAQLGSSLSSEPCGGFVCHPHQLPHCNQGVGQFLHQSELSPADFGFRTVRLVLFHWFSAVLLMSRTHETGELVKKGVVPAPSSPKYTNYVVRVPGQPCYPRVAGGTSAVWTSSKTLWLIHALRTQRSAASSSTGIREGRSKPREQ